MKQLNKIQTRCLNAIQNDNCKLAFLALIERHPRYWKRALFEQFATDENVCFVHNKFLPCIRQIRNANWLVGVLY